MHALVLPVKGCTAYRVRAFVDIVRSAIYTAGQSSDGNRQIRTQQLTLQVRSVGGVSAQVLNSQPWRGLFGVLFRRCVHMPVRERRLPRTMRAVIHISWLSLRQSTATCCAAASQSGAAVPRCPPRLFRQPLRTRGPCAGQWQRLSHAAGVHRTVPRCQHSAQRPNSVANAPWNRFPRHLAEAFGLVKSTCLLQCRQVHGLLSGISLLHEAAQQRVTYACAPVARQPGALYMIAAIQQDVHMSRPSNMQQPGRMLQHTLLAVVELGYTHALRDFISDR